MNERKEGWMRLLVGIVTGVILYAWAYLIGVLWIVQFLITIFSGKRNKGIAEFCEIWNTQGYIFTRYMLFVSNERPFPFKELKKSMSAYEK